MLHDVRPPIQNFTEDALDNHETRSLERASHPVDMNRITGKSRKESWKWILYKTACVHEAYLNQSSNKYS